MKNISRSTLNDIIEWDISSWSKCLCFWLSKGKIDLENARVLEIGSRNGGLSLWAALNGAKVICSDLGGPNKKAYQKHKNHNLSDLITYKDINALDIPYENELDIVLSKSVIGGIGRNNNIENQKITISEIYKSLRKGGEYWFTENLLASPAHKILRSQFIQWGDEWRYVTIDDMNEFLHQFSSVEYITTGFISCFGRTEKQRKILSFFDRFLFSKIVPKKWNYIIIGVAKK
ncbi:class I SAM-dependent methyltransferase [Photorhabdus heterorhabditis]|uniref:class I SAM-dependent methyltransferase n=1 Tax=Photorhabdus heterorhabditis TaxID=880156 RepID=UPI00156201F5|nr:class I SAM-dependent methyltransferase [Photorhabdus heterorhabditis]NRN30796.1 class I SAM-dependent methyltransferase [Photorhabdus heterorhabditis subsp. aluminescens]